MSERTKALAISAEAKRIVYERDRGRCVFCGRPGLPEAHYISRSRGGLGIPENILTVCRECHRRMDQTTERVTYMVRAREYLELFYPGFDDNERIYRRRK